MNAGSISADERLAVLREMVRLAEYRRGEAISMLEKINQYSMAMVAFSGTILSLLVTADFSEIAIMITGFPLIVSICCALMNIIPKPLKGATLLIQKDIDDLRTAQRMFSLDAYLLDIAELTETAATVIGGRATRKKRTMTISACFLALSLACSYFTFIYAAARNPH